MEDVQKFIDEQVKSNPVVLFMKARRNFRSVAFPAPWRRF